MFIDPETGEMHSVKPEYSTMSRRPGIGKGWFDKYKKDVYPRDYLIVNGQKTRPPKYYDGQYELENEFGMNRILIKRRKEGSKSDENTLDRLEAREKVKRAQIKEIKRKLL